MKSYKLLRLLMLLALTACTPTPGPPVSTPTTEATATTAAPSPTNPATTSASATATSASATATLMALPSIAPPSQTPSPTTKPTTTASPTPTQPPWGQRTKASGCQVHGAYPDPACTPGDIFPKITKDNVCRLGYRWSVGNVPTSERDAVYAEYGIKRPAAGLYEVDHLVSVELGGSNDISNLFPEAASPMPGYHEKDRVENYLHDQVCRGAITLEAAQVMIATDWLAVYRSLPPGAGSSATPGPTRPTPTKVPHIGPTGTKVILPSSTPAPTQN